MVDTDIKDIAGRLQDAAVSWRGSLLLAVGSNLDATDGACDDTDAEWIEDLAQGIDPKMPDYTRRAFAGSNPADRTVYLSYLSSVIVKFHTMPDPDRAFVDRIAEQLSGMMDAGGF